ncbi:MAG TPA: hypothetical protein VGL93_10400 [Streptosporangiaceae bacterium]
MTEHTIDDLDEGSRRIILWTPAEMAPDLAPAARMVWRLANRHHCTAARRADPQPCRAFNAHARDVAAALESLRALGLADTPPGLCAPRNAYGEVIRKPRGAAGRARQKRQETTT